MTIAIIGAGKVGAYAALNCGLRELDDVLLLDIVEGLPQGEAMDINHQLAERGSDCIIRGSTNYEDMKGSDIVIVVAGMGRKPGMTRMDLLKTNADIVKNVALKIATYAKESKIIIVTNPLDPMTYLTLKITGFGKNNVMGMGGMLDLSRFKNFIQDATKVSRQSIQALVIGEHGENMLPLIRFSSIGGIPLTQVISKEQAQDIFDHTKKVAAEVIALKGATIFAPGNAIATMVEAIIKNKRSVIPVSTLLEGEYGASNLCIGVPTIIGSNGVEKIIELELDTIEQNIFNQGITSLRDAINALSI
ncbi:MAG TPA: malate dehydrogenase [Nitrososphaeraceae archaeon]|jgi:malate dehydrogenase|nr:malate dehydrogenase [Nitrososphaeraceae archaeon]